MRSIVAVLAAAGLLGWAGLAAAALCPKCRDLLFVELPGKCSVCGAATASGALKLCPQCSAQRHQCEHCLAALAAENPPPAASPPPSPPPAAPAAALPPLAASPLPAVQIENLPAVPAAKPPTQPAPAQPAPAAPARIDPTRSGAYNYGNWQYRLDVAALGTRGEGRWGWLWYNGQLLPRAAVNDYYQTPWGALYWSDWPAVREGLHGWLPGPVAQGPRPGRPLALPATAGAPRPPTLEVTKIHNGRRAICQVGTLIVIRLPGNPTTGYQWTALPASNPVMRLVGPPQYAPAAGLPGAGGQFVFTFQAIRPGTGSIRLVYARPWDRSAPAADSFSLGVEVQPGAATN